MRKLLSLRTLAVVLLLALLTGGTIAVAESASAAPATAGPADTTAPATSTTSPSDRLPFGPLVDYAAQRDATADDVAKAKWVNHLAIDDPAREQAVIDSVRSEAVQLGIDPDEVEAVFRDLIEANKMIQRWWFQFWTDNPDQAPTTAPDLTTVRAKINTLNDEIVHELANTTELRHSSGCPAALSTAVAAIDYKYNLQGIYKDALAYGIRRVCV